MFSFYRIKQLSLTYEATGTSLNFSGRFAVGWDPGSKDFDGKPNSYADVANRKTRREGKVTSNQKLVIPASAFLLKKFQARPGQGFEDEFENPGTFMWYAEGVKNALVDVTGAIGVFKLHYVVQCEQYNPTYDYRYAYFHLPMAPNEYQVLWEDKMLTDNIGCTYSGAALTLPAGFYEISLQKKLVSAATLSFDVDGADT